MILLKQGDQLPIVATVQLMLNSRLSERSPLKVDGIFGPKTKEAVIAFQKRDGQVDSSTWARLTEHTRLQVRDIVDVSDPLLLQSHQILTEIGSAPISIGPSSNAVGFLAPSIVSSGVKPGMLALLRFHGHGNSGIQVVGYGHLGLVVYDVIRRQPFPGFDRFDRRAVQRLRRSPDMKLAR
jgi:peptidoglycan hydrolase-like protein with peptidoglycan-binding domain